MLSISLLIISLLIGAQTRRNVSTEYPVHVRRFLQLLGSDFKRCVREGWIEFLTTDEGEDKG